MEIVLLAICRKSSGLNAWKPSLLMKVYPQPHSATAVIPEDDSLKETRVNALYVACTWKLAKAVLQVPTIRNRAFECRVPGRCSERAGRQRGDCQPDRFPRQPRQPGGSLLEDFPVIQT